MPARYAASLSSVWTYWPQVDPSLAVRTGVMAFQAATLMEPDEGLAPRTTSRWSAMLSVPTSLRLKVTGATSSTGTTASPRNRRESVTLSPGSSMPGVAPLARNCTAVAEAGGRGVRVVAQTGQGGIQRQEGPLAAILRRRQHQERRRYGDGARIGIIHIHRGGGMRLDGVGHLDFRGQRRAAVADGHATGEPLASP